MTRPCITPHCTGTTRTPTPRCPTCETNHQKQRNATRLHYKGDYRRRAALAKANATHCWLCKQPFQPNDQIDADHVRPGDPTSPIRAAHAHCNRSRGNHPPPPHTT